MRQDAAPEERPELLLHESGQPGAIRPVGRLAQELLQMIANDGMEHGVFGVAGPVERSLEGHALMWGQGADRDNAERLIHPT